MKNTLFSLLLALPLLPAPTVLAAPEQKKTFCNVYDNRRPVAEGSVVGCPAPVTQVAKSANGWLTEATSRGEKARGCRHFQSRFEEVAKERQEALKVCNDKTKVKLGAEGEMLARNEQAAQMRASAIGHLEDCVAKLERVRVKAFNQTQQSIRVADKSTLQDRQTARDLEVQVKKVAEKHEAELSKSSPNYGGNRELQNRCVEAKNESLRLLGAVERNYEGIAQLGFKTAAELLATEKLRFEGALLKLKAIPALPKTP